MKTTDLQIAGISLILGVIAFLWSMVLWVYKSSFGEDLFAQLDSGLLRDIGWLSIATAVGHYLYHFIKKSLRSKKT